MTVGDGETVLAEFNAMEPGEAIAWLTPCVAIDSWTTGLVGGRPYPDAAALLARGQALATIWTDGEVEAALADHPRIGEKHTGSGTSAAMSSSEQSGLTRDADTAQLLREGNERYEARFGRIYLVRAKGRTSDELLAMLEERLGNDEASELRVVKEQLGEIAVLRLAALLEVES